MSDTPDLLAAFSEAASPPKAKKPSPFCLRLTFNERAQLEAEAGDMPLGAYIKFKLFSGAGSPHPILAARELAFELVDAGPKTWRDVLVALEQAGVNHTIIQRLALDRWFHVTIMIRLRDARTRRADAQRLAPRKPR